MNRVDRFRKNTISSLAYQVIALISGIIIPRLFIVYYGSSTYGLVSSITSFLGFITILDLGIGAVISSNLFKPLAEKDTSKINNIIIYSRRFYNRIAVLLVLYTVLLFFIYPTFINSGFNDYFVGSLIVIISISVFAQHFFGVVYTLLLKSDQRQYIVFNLNIITLLINTIITIFLINAGISVHLVKLSGSIIFFLKPLVLNVYVKRNYNINKRITVKKSPIEQQWNGVAQHLAYLIQDKTDIIILTWFSTLGNVSVYSIYYLIVSGIRSFIYASTAGFSALLGNLIAKNETHRLRSLFVNFEWIIYNISTLLFTTTAILIIDFIKIYTKGISDVNYILPSFAVVLTLSAAIRCFQLPYNTVVQAALHFKETQKSAIIEPIINIVISVLLVEHLGLVGVSIGTFISISYRTLYLILYLSEQIIHISKRETLKLFVVNVISAGLMGLASNVISINNHSYFGWALSGIIILSINVAIMFSVNLVFYKKYINAILIWLRVKYKI